MSLNIWGGHLKNELIEFVKKHRDIDVLCMQEVYYKAKERITDETRFLSLDILSEIHEVLKDFQLFFSPVVNGIYGLATLINPNVKTISKGTAPIYSNPKYSGIGPAHSRILQYVTCQVDDHLVTLVNIHGLWNGKGKGDCKERIEQSLNIKKFMKTINNSVVLLGDFNLTPNSESFQILEKDMQNCISKYKIDSTRTSYYPKKERFADYMLLSNDLMINDFEVLSDEVSDHCPLFLDFEFAKHFVS